MNRTLRWILAASAPVVALLGGPGALQAQTCEVNNQASCIVSAGTITIRVTRAARLVVPATTVALPQADIPAFQSGFGTPQPVAITVQSNSAWSLGVNGGAAFWTATPGSARQTKPVGDLQWATAAGGPYADLTQTLATIASGAPTGTGAVTLYLRGRYTWAVDSPGAYSVPLVVTLTAP